MCPYLGFHLSSLEVDIWMMPLFLGEFDNFGGELERIMELFELGSAFEVLFVCDFPRVLVEFSVYSAYSGPVGSLSSEAHASRTSSASAMLYRSLHSLSVCSLVAIGMVDEDMAYTSMTGGTAFGPWADREKVQSSDSETRDVFAGLAKLI